MGKKCIICDEEAVYVIKGTSDTYCEECAKEQFSDLSYLHKIEDEKEKPFPIKEEDLDGDSGTGSEEE